MVIDCCGESEGEGAVSTVAMMSGAVAHQQKFLLASSASWASDVAKAQEVN